MKKLILFFLASIVLISCNKKVTLKGRVLNPVTNQGIEGFTIAVSADTWELPGGAKPVGQTTSGADGSFVLEFKRSGYDFSVYKEGYYNIGWYQNGEILPGQLSVKDKGKNMKADFYAVPYGELQINVKNINCFNQSDTLSIFRTHSIPDYYDDVPNPAIYVGCIDNIGNMNKSPMGWYKYKGKVIRNGIETTIKDSIYLGAGETEVWNIYY